MRLPKLLWARRGILEVVKVDVTGNERRGHFSCSETRITNNLGRFDWSPQCRPEACYDRLDEGRESDNEVVRALHDDNHGEGPKRTTRPSIRRP